MVLVVVVLATGIGMIGSIHAMAAQAGGQFNMPVNWIVMSILGLVMMAVFGHIRFALFKRLNAAVQLKDHSPAARRWRASANGFPSTWPLAW